MVLARPRILFATIGKDPNYIVPLEGDQPKGGPFDEIHIFIHRNWSPEVQRAFIQLQSRLRGFETQGGLVQEHRYSNCFDFDAIAGCLNAAYEGCLHRLGSNLDCVVNASRGTTPAIMAATLFAREHACQLVYYGDQRLDGLVIPTEPAKVLHAGPSEAKERVLRAVFENGPLSLSTLRAKMGGLSWATIHQHVEEMEKAGLVTSNKVGRERMVEANLKRARMALQGGAGHV